MIATSPTKSRVAVTSVILLIKSSWLVLVFNTYTILKIRKVDPDLLLLLFSLGGGGGGRVGGGGARRVRVVQKIT